MIKKTLTKEEWLKALRGLGNEFKVFVPLKEGEVHRFGLLQDGAEPDFQSGNTRISPKEVVYPQSERMFEYSLDGSNPEAHILKESRKDFSPQVIAGIRPCDGLAFQLVKINFDNPQYRDPWWVQRMEATTLIGMGCNDPCATCFCSSVGTGPFGEKGLDAMMVDLGDRFLLRSLTPKGEALLQKVVGGKEAGDTELAKAEENAASAGKKISSRMETDKLRSKETNQLFDAPFWEDVSFACLNCGVCTFLCPTCWCFDIQDEVCGKEGDRIRNWDACMFPLFTLHGSGHNPRDKKVQRVRQRFMHKLKYYPDKYDNGVCCVGCGRCVQHCPVNIDIRKVARLMNDL